MRRIQYEEREPVSKRIGRFITLVSAVTAIVCIVLIGQRLNDQSLALVVGLLLAGVPQLALCIVLVILLLRSQRQAHPPPAPQPTPPQQQMMLPPIIMQMPTYPQPMQPLPWTAEPATQRGWDLIGEEENS